MTKQELLAKYNPANVRNLSQADIAAMREFTDDELKALAEAYPNNPNRKPYLILYDKNIPDAGKQLYPLSTWQNLYNVRKFSAKKNLVAHTFRELFTLARPNQSAKSVARAGSTLGKNTTSARKVVDLSAQEAADELTQNLKQPAPVKTMVAKTVPENETEATGTSVAQPAVKSASARSTKSARSSTASKKAAETAAAEAQNDAAKNLPADQQLADLGGDDVTDTNVGDTNNGGDEGKGDNLGL